MLSGSPAATKIDFVAHGRDVLVQTPGMVAEAPRHGVVGHDRQADLVGDEDDSPGGRPFRQAASRSASASTSRFGEHQVRTPRASGSRRAAPGPAPPRFRWRRPDRAAPRRCAMAPADALCARRSGRSFRRRRPGPSPDRPERARSRRRGARRRRSCPSARRRGRGRGGRSRRPQPARPAIASSCSPRITAPAPATTPPDTRRPKFSRAARPLPRSRTAMKPAVTATTYWMAANPIR